MSENNPLKKAVVLLSGGLDSATVLAIARQQQYECHALSFDYGQRHRVELLAAERIVKTLHVAHHRTLVVDLTQIGGSALTDNNIEVPQSPASGIPVTYVPARNIIFLSFALAYAETIQASDIFIGVNVLDYSGYPDCRPEFIESYTRMANLGTRAGVEGDPVRIHTPLIKMNKAEIIAAGTALGVDYAQTISCYQADADGRACGLCDSCRFRKKGFVEAGVADPTLYQ
jgi:7-cyano-7-deazaguanine synthase